MLKKTALACVFAAFGTGCAVQEIDQFRTDIHATDHRATQHAKEAERPYASRNATVVSDDSVWIPVKRVAKRPEVKNTHPSLKRAFEVNRTFYSINDVAEHISRVTGIPVHVASDVNSPQGNAGNSDNSGLAQSVQGVASNNGLPPPPSVGMNTNGGAGTSAGVIALSYSGDLSGFLNSASARLGVSWEMRNGTIEFFRYATKTFALSAVPGDVLSKASLNATGGASAGSSGSSSAGGTSGVANAGQTGAITGENTISTESIADLSVWKSIKSSIDVMLSAGGSVVVNPAIGTITVRDYPRNIEAIEKFIEGQNASLTKQVVINVKVLSVTLNKEHNYGINWDIVRNNLSSSGIDFRFLSAAPVLSGATTLTATLVGANRKFNGSEAMVSALSSVGDVSIVTSTTQVTLNNQPVPVRVGRQTAYLQSSTSSQASNVGTTTALTPGTVTTGFAMNMLPHIQPDGKIMMQYNIDLSSLLRISTVTSGDSTIQTPEIDTRTFMQRLAMRSGETVVMSGFEQTEDTADSQGLGHEKNILMGGAAKGSRNKKTIVILLTANVVDKI